MQSVAASALGSASLRASVIERLRAHIRQMPRARLTIKAQPLAKRASVLVPLCNDHGVPSILFTKRPSTMANHPGQVHSQRSPLSFWTASIPLVSISCSPEFAL
jgi:hypothetical protein